MQKGNRSWAHPIDDWNIILRFRQKDIFYETEFKTITHFSKYLSESPTKANAVGYKVPDDGRLNYVPVSDVTLHFWHRNVDGKEERIQLKDVFELARYLQVNPALAKAVSYQIKSKG